jgi:threonine dehydrogenase-like Zn-dependent dehydrogenase
VRALVFRAGVGLGIEDLPEPTPRPDELLIRPHYVQLCLTDVLNAERWPPRWDEYTDDGRRRQHGGRWGYAWTDGMVPGHEGGGDVVAVGSAVTGFGVGDRVLVDAVYRCGRCPECLAHRVRECRVYLRRDAAGRPAGPTYLGVNAPEPERFGRGMLAEYCAVPATMCYRCPPEVPPLGVVGGEIGGATLGSVRCSGMRLGDHVVQIGGQLFGGHRLQLARAAGADRVIYVESDSVRRGWAEERGLADAVIDPGAGDARQQVRAALGGAADVVFASAVEPGSWRLAARIVRPGGIIVPFDSDPRLPEVFLDGFDTALLTERGVRWTGHLPLIGASDPSRDGRTPQSRNDHQIFVDLMAQGRIDGGAAVTSVVSLWDDVESLRRAFRTPWREDVRTAVRVWGAPSAGTPASPAEDEL